MDKSLVCNASSKDNDPFGELKIFSGKASKSLASEIGAKLGIELAQSETKTFSEGNVFVRVLENVRGRDVFIIQGTEYPVNDNFMELLFWIDAFRRASATQVTAVIPFFSYAKGDKKDEPRVSIRARVCADAIEAAGADRVLTMDLHSPQIQGFFKIPVDHLYAMPVLVDYFRKKQIPDLVVAAPDVGFGKQAYRYAQMMHTNVVFGNKVRHSHDEKAEMLDIVGQVEGKNVLIVDDFTISGGTLIEMAKACKERGALDVYACVSHGVFSKGSAEKIARSPIKELVLTDTIGHRFEPLAPCCKVISVAGLFAEAIQSIHRRESVSRLFDF
ncbi:ribose-phosphate diphosphokinase [Singulisphaera acidiphila]|uniref:ribose-phosphate diphosphokinase n=1 Tax=Singulisphaera acidiphila (strain ATCC BAA-1392 / DSM 18658 / VKM B-2454 / MOB10) TaxID=886293 RepID=L0DF85_SINAD|nr:ribose-phosphate pyrophosphokinase [Singulisphaera acidiphila]AGA27336.1 ribose-phosphate pyrophosphokinase [Singulisphaera acidiphila DSM 18658]